MFSIAAHAIFNTVLTLGLCWSMMWMLGNWRQKHRCPYCGKDGGHDDDCPRNGIEGL